MIVIFTNHARGQLAERSISADEVAAVIKSPESRVQEHDRIVYQKITVRSGKRQLLRVITIERNDRTRVLTVYRTSKITKYL